MKPVHAAETGNGFNKNLPFFLWQKTGDPLILRVDCRFMLNHD